MTIVRHGSPDACNHVVVIGDDIAFGIVQYQSDGRSDASYNIKVVQ